MIVIRLECSDGQGMFRIRKKGFNLMDSEAGKRISHAHDTFPEPYTEFGDAFTKKHYCAYKSISQLLKWIGLDDLKDIIGQGVNLYIIRVKNPLIGEYQIGFQKKHIQWKKKINDII
jgi:hypothetical protein